MLYRTGGMELNQSYFVNGESKIEQDGFLANNRTGRPALKLSPAWNTLSGREVFE